MSARFIDRPVVKLVLINCGVALGVLVAYRHGYRGVELLLTGIVTFVLFNAAGCFGIWLGRKSKPVAPNKYVKLAWIILGLVWLIYLLGYMFPSK
jgi:hypothetical protein